MRTRTWPPLRRFEVAERSMEPAFEPGDYLVASGWLRVRPGHVVVLEHPERAGFWLVKRVEGIEGTEARVVSDNRDATLADSRSFGPVPLAGLYRVVLRYWPPRRITARFPEGRRRGP